MISLLSRHSARLGALVLAVALLGALPRSAMAQKAYDPGASDAEIVIGNSNPYSGNASTFGLIGRTVEAVFKKVNDEGGINGRKIRFVTYDDAYSPPRTLEMTRRLVEVDQVLFIFQTLGTPPNTAIQKYLNDRKVPQLFIATGASKFGRPQEFPWTMGWQPDYTTEAAIYARHILATVKEPRIAVLMQNDDYGRDYFDGFLAGLGKENEKLIVARTTYEVTDATVDSQIIQLKASGANVFFNITLPKFAAQAIRKAHELGWKPAHYLNTVSSSFSSVLRPAGIEASQGLLLALYRKDVADPQWANDEDVKAFRAFMGKYMRNDDVRQDLHNYGYAATHTLIEVLRRAGDDLTRANIMRQAASLKGFAAPLLMPGITVNTSPTDYFPIQSMRMARVKGESFELLGDLISYEAK